MVTLALLVGTNPLPNAVAAYWLCCQPEGAPERVRLYYTRPRPDVHGDQGTSHAAERLKSFLERRFSAQAGGQVPVELRPLPTPIDAQAVRRSIADDLLNQEGSALHVNYTGGTKAMARGAWLAAEDAAGHGHGVVVSYLDDRQGQHCLRLGSLYQNGTITWRRTDDLRWQVSLNLSELLALHGFTRQGRPRRPDAIGQDHLRRLEAALGQVGLAPGQQTDGRSLFSSPPAGLCASFQQAPPQSLDLLAIAGYQALVCQVPADQGNRGYDPTRIGDVKHAAFRALMLATRLGGEEARACVTSTLDDDQASLVQQSLTLDDRDDVRRVTVLGRSHMDQPDLLRRTLEEMLR
ncbi:MAG: hypothetical protein HY690_04325 [Chloroflexi bacterium]|nr:hypothetical protein [Chloroflexota bacterium]